MKKIVALIPLFVATLAFAACSEGGAGNPVAPEPTTLQSLSANIVTPVRINEVYELNEAWYVQCANDGAGEDVALEGAVHFLISYTTDAHGYTHYESLMQLMGVHGTGVVTGDRYVAIDVSPFTGTSGAVINGTSTGIIKFVGRGRNGDFTLRIVGHYGTNAAGELVVDFFRYFEGCS